MSKPEIRPREARGPDEPAYFAREKRPPRVRRSSRRAPGDEPAEFERDEVVLDPSLVEDPEELAEEGEKTTPERAPGEPAEHVHDEVVFPEPDEP